ncbi:MAG: hypothetical protein QOJ97_1031 [Solirubrobacteraceae bacterium]|nr:hypothetical protein [Solirubrobacteraceae bacterium]
MGSKNRQAKARARKVPSKNPKAAPVATSTRETPFFCFHHADRATKEAWAFKPGGGQASELLDFLCDMGRLKWNDIESQETGTRKRRRKHHSQSIGSLDTAAQADLRKRKLDETFGDEMFRFRLSGKSRLWGFRAKRVFHVIWWDPDHQVYPTEPS